VPKNSINDPKIPLPMGYAEAKWVCEKGIESAHQHLCDVEPVILRIGQLTGLKHNRLLESQGNIFLPWFGHPKSLVPCLLYKA